MAQPKRISSPWKEIPEVGSSSSRPPNSPREASSFLQLNDSAKTADTLQCEAYESLHSLLAESGIEKMKNLPRSLIMCECSRLWVQAATPTQAPTEYGCAKEDEVDCLEPALVQEDSRVYRLRKSVKDLEAQLSSAYH
ncbi:hypothetical protein LIER_37973 [Lithospermum erythrorhizon]|uniref:Uncharacterized protein n=1 Tax=Lithospermum erythrorhizon TaxID=34254 RepID=A0AAV3PSQ4_LITER